MCISEQNIIFGLQYYQSKAYQNENKTYLFRTVYIFILNMKEYNVMTLNETGERDIVLW